MKKIALMAVAAVTFFATGCNTVDTWGDGLPEMEHVYYVGFYKTNVNTNYLHFEVAVDGTSRWCWSGNANPTSTWNSVAETNVAPVPFQFHSERVRTYDAVTNFWIVNADGSSLVAGTDYSVSMDGTALSPSSGVYSFSWPQTKKGVRDVKIKRLTANTGKLLVYVLDPAKGTPNPSEYTTTTVNNKTSEYGHRPWPEFSSRCCLCVLTYAACVLM